MEEPMMTAAQRDELKTLCQKADVPDKSGELLTREGAQHFIGSEEATDRAKVTAEKPLEALGSSGCLLPSRGRCSRRVGSRSCVRSHRSRRACC